MPQLVMGAGVWDEKMKAHPNEEKTLRRRKGLSASETYCRYRKPFSWKSK